MTPTLDASGVAAGLPWHFTSCHNLLFFAPLRLCVKSSIPSQQPRALAAGLAQFYLTQRRKDRKGQGADAQAYLPPN